MTDITIEGITLTTDEAREVVAWVDEPWRPMPKRMFWVSGRPHLREYGGCEMIFLTPTVIEALRDHVTPWVEVATVKRGDAVKQCGRQGTCTDQRIDGWQLVVDGGGLTWLLDPGRPVLVRRPRPSLTLGEVEAGTKLSVGSWEEAQALGAYDPEGRRQVLNLRTWLTDWIRSDTPVRIVEGES